MVEKRKKALMYLFVGSKRGIMTVNLVPSIKLKKAEGTVENEQCQNLLDTVHRTKTNTTNEQNTSKLSFFFLRDYQYYHQLTGKCNLIVIKVSE
jgi:hypothetical protein